MLTWLLAGAGVGLAYPVVYVTATDADTVPGTGALTLATAVVAAEAVGEVAGGSLGPAIVTTADRLGGVGLAGALGAATASLLVAASWAFRAHSRWARRSTPGCRAVPEPGVSRARAG